MSDLPEAVQALIDTPRYERASGCDVNSTTIRAMCAAVENANPVYWDSQHALEEVGGEYAPAALLSCWDRPELWAPDTDETIKPLQLHFDLKELFDYPVAIIGSFESVFHTPLQSGDQVRSQQVLQSVSDEKDTRLGRGRFWTIAVHYHNQRDELVGVDNFNCFGYRKGDA